MKIKVNDQEVKDGKAQKTDTIEEHEAEEEPRIPKRELDEEGDVNTNADKRIRLETDHDATHREHITLETISRDLNISALQKNRRSNEGKQGIDCTMSKQ